MNQNNNTKKSQLGGALLLLLAALIWGTAFVAQSEGADKIPAFTFNGLRMLIGALTLAAFICLRRLWSALRRKDPAPRREPFRTTFVHGALVGVALFGASSAQQYAFNDSSAGKIAFITALYMFFVPLIGLLFGKRVPIVTWISVCIGFVGLYFLSIDPADPLSVNRGDLMALLCSVIYAVQILLVERYSANADSAELSAVEFAVCSVIAVAAAALFESPSAEAILSAAPQLLWTGVMSCGVAFTLQVVGQKRAEATAASLMMCMESVFGVLSAAVLLGDRMTGREILGCSVMFFAIVLSQVGERLVEALRAQRAKY